jgi:hypothetical protein
MKSSFFLNQWINVKWPVFPQAMQAGAQFCYALIGLHFLDWPKSNEIFASVLLFGFFYDGILYLIFPQDGRRFFRVSSSAVIISASTFLMVQSGVVWGYLICMFFGITAKHIFRVNSRHVFNPTNIGVLSLALLFPEFGGMVVDQWGGATHLIIIMLILGTITTFVAKKLWISFSYLGGFLLFAIMRSYLFDLPVLTIAGTLLGAPALLFAMHMINDPQTTPVNWKNQLMFGLLVALLDVTLRTNQILFAPLIALAITSSLRAVVIQARELYGSGQYSTAHR